MSAAALRPGAAALREPAFRRLLAAQWTSLLGDALLVAALPFAVFALGGGAADVGLAFGAHAAALVALLLLGGVAGDRLSRRAVVICADLARAGGQGVLALLILTGHGEVWHVVAAQALLGAGTAFALPALTALVPDTVPARALQDANALRGLALSTAGLGGPALAGVLVVAAGAGWAVALDALTFAASAALVARLGAGAAPAPRPDSTLAQLRAGWREFRARRWVWAVVAQFALVNALVLAPFHVLGASLAHASLGGAGAWALVLSASGGGAVAGALVALAWRPRRPLVVATLAVATWAAPLALLAAGAGVAAVAPAAAVAGGALALFAALWETALQRHVTPAQLARVSAYDCLGSFAGLPLGFALAAPVAALVGPHATLAGAAAVAVVASAAVARLPEVRALGSARAPEASLAGIALRSDAGTVAGGRAARGDPAAVRGG